VNGAIDAIKAMDIKAAMREAFGKCPKCGSKAVAGQWLRFCPKRCRWAAPK
jgi:hypothetical protein